MDGAEARPAWDESLAPLALCEKLADGVVEAEGRAAFVQMTQHVAATLAEILGEDRDARGIKLTRFRSSQMLDEEEDQAEVVSLLTRNNTSENTSKILQNLKNLQNLQKDQQLWVAAQDGDTTEVTFESAVIATGSVPATIPGFEFDGELVVGGGYHFRRHAVFPCVVCASGGLQSGNVCRVARVGSRMPACGLEVGVGDL